MESNMKKLVTITIQCGEFDVPAFLRKMADFAEKNKSLIDKQDYYEYSDETGVCEFDYE
jgi:hypothetical protein